MTTWDDVARIRRGVADLVEPLTEAQLDHATDCGTWTPRLILSHLVAFVDTPRRSFAAAMVRSRFDADQAFDALARRGATRPVESLAATLRAKATRAPLGNPLLPPGMPFTDAVVHDLDIRRALGLTGGPTLADIQAALDFVTSHRMGRVLVDRSVLDGIHLQATDGPWESGTGDLVSGPMADLLVAVFGRPAGTALTGPGAARFA